MAARATRSASRAARREQAVATGPLGALSHDELGVIFEGLTNPLRPYVAVALSSTCLGLRTPLLTALEVLELQHLEALQLLKVMGIGAGRPALSCSQLLDADEIALNGMRAWDDRCMSTLGMILRTNPLPKLGAINLSNNNFTDAGFQALCDGLVHFPRRSLRKLYVFVNDLGPAPAPPSTTTAEGLASAFTGVRCQISRSWAWVEIRLAI